MPAAPEKTIIILRLGHEINYSTASREFKMIKENNCEISSKYVYPYVQHSRNY
jgi:hypothetical protein